MEISVGWDVIITLIIAVYGAILSTYMTWNARQEHKREIKVQTSFGFIKSPFSGVSPLMIISTAMNTGRKTVTLSSVGLILPNKDKEYLTFLKPNSAVSFPYDLVEGKSCQVWDTAKELAVDLKREGYSGRINLKGYYKDAIGNEFRSKPLRFNIDKALQDAKT